MGGPHMDTNARKALGRLIADGRNRLEWKVGDLAANSPYSVSAIQSFESGRAGGRDTFTALAKALNRELAKRQLDLIPLDHLEYNPASHHWLTPALASRGGSQGGPASLLEARIGIVPWQGSLRDKQLKDLVTWCQSPEPIRGFAIKGDGGMGKTRLAVALCQKLKADGGWITGFIQPRRFPKEPAWWNSLRLEGRSILLVADYTSRPGMLEVLNAVLPALHELSAKRVRILLLDRTVLPQGLLDGDAWRAWDAIRDGHLPHLGPQLGPVSADSQERLYMFEAAVKAFAPHLGVKEADLNLAPLKNPGSKAYDQILLLHMQALERLFDSTPKSDVRNSILNRLLERERQHWREAMKRLEMPSHLFEAVQAAVVRVCEVGGLERKDEAKEAFLKLSEFRGLPDALVGAVVTLLCEVYPDGDQGIAPLRPDPLYDHLANQRLEG